jgi:hypothetical protein
LVAARLAATFQMAGDLIGKLSEQACRNVRRGV